MHLWGFEYFLHRMSELGQQRKSAEATEMSVPGGRADLIFGRLEVRF